jgi:hypothetical protein
VTKVLLITIVDEINDPPLHTTFIEGINCVTDRKLLLG